MTDNINLVAISDFKARCLKILDQVKKTGTPILVTKRGEPIAMVVAPPPPKNDATWLGAFAGTAEIKGDIISPVSDGREWEVFRS
jgi:prevent-host-death family protein